MKETVRLVEVGTATSGNHNHVGRKGEVGGSAPSGGVSDVAYKATIKLRSGEGFSFTMKGNVPKDGYMVSKIGSEETKPLTVDVQPTDVQSYIDTHKAELSVKGHYFGGWVTNSPHSVTFDVSERIASKSKALDVGHERNQIAIWDVAASKELFVMSDHKNPNVSEGVRLYESMGVAPKVKRFLFGPDVTATEAAKIINQLRNE